jgi:hypothetical protein
LDIFRTHLLWAIIDVDSSCISPPSHQIAYSRTQHEHERTRFDACRSLHRHSLRTACSTTYDIVEFDELRACLISMIFPYPDHISWFHETANCCREYAKVRHTFFFGALSTGEAMVSSKVPSIANAHRFSESAEILWCVYRSQVCFSRRRTPHCGVTEVETRK